MRRERVNRSLDVGKPIDLHSALQSSSVWLKPRNMRLSQAIGTGINISTLRLFWLCRCSLIKAANRGNDSVRPLSFNRRNHLSMGGWYGQAMRYWSSELLLFRQLPQTSRGLGVRLAHPVQILISRGS